VESTRDQILRYVRGRRETSVHQLAESLGLSQQAVRRHLDGLRADGFLDAKLERHGVGRPALVFFATERGEELSGRTYLQLLSRLFRHLEKSEGESAAGHHVLDDVFAGIAAEVAADHQSEVHGGTLAERVAQAAAALEREGIVDGWEQQGDVFEIHNDECPYLRLAAMSDAPCRSDRQTIELLVGANVEQVKRIVDGAMSCEYVVRPAQTEEQSKAQTQTK
jgi:predicted ArsR family transcriptional regulator